MYRASAERPADVATQFPAPQRMQPPDGGPSRSSARPQLMRFKPGDVFGELQILRDMKCPFDIRAATAVDPLTFDEAGNYQKHP